MKLIPIALLLSFAFAGTYKDTPDSRDVDVTTKLVCHSFVIVILILTYGIFS